jgi:RHS repeat-associated protein
VTGRPTDWHVLDLDRDPVPGDPFEVRELARKLGDFADDVAGALRSVRGLNGDSVVREWAGLSGDAYRDQFGELPGRLDKLERSYRLASGALDDYWPRLETAQGDADRALAQGRTARQELESAQSQLTNADAWVRRAREKSTAYQDDPKPNVPPPSAEEVRAASRNATDANAAHTTASTAVHTAQAKLDAAKQLAADAAQLRDDAASTAQQALHEASDAGIKNKHWWEKAVDWVADHWDDIIAVCKVIVAVLGIVVLIIGGPLAWLVLAAAILVLADTVMKYLQGKASLWDVLFAALDCIPMFKGLTTAGGFLKMARELPALLKSGKALENIANSIRKGASSLGETSRMLKKLFTCGDPIDMATGEMVLAATDVELPAVLPLVLERTHRTGFRGGRWFGPTWASTLDQRLIADDQGVRFTTADGMTLDYPVPDPGRPVLPVTGPRWPLTWDGALGGGMSVSRPDTGHTLHFRPLPAGAPGELPIAAVTDRNDNHIEYHYDPATGAPTQIVHHAGYRIAVTTADGQVTALHLASAADRPLLLAFGHTGGHLTTVTNCSGLPLTFTYDTEGRITRWQDRNSTWYGYTYDTHGRCVRTTGTDDILAYTYRFDTGTHTTEAVNSLGHTTTYQFNDRYQLLRETDPLGHTTHRTWDNRDNLLTHTDPLGRTTRHTYDAHDNPTGTELPDGTRLSVEYDGPGRPVRITDAVGATWSARYDARGNVVAVTDPRGGVSEFGYDTAGRLTSTTDMLGNRRTYQPNSAGQPVMVVGPTGAESRFTYDAFGRVRTATDELGGVTEHRWDTEGQLVEVRLADGATEEWSYDGEGNVVGHRDAGGGRTVFETAPFDRIAARTGPDGERFTFAYDTELRLTSVTSGAGLTWRYSYDAAGRPIREEDFNGRVISYVYDAAGQIIERVNGAGETIRLEYDAAGSVTRQRTPTGDTRFSYDPAGLLIRATSADADLVIERDPLGHVVAETCNGRTVSSGYDLAGRRISRTTPSGVTSTWTYDDEGRPLTLDTSGRSLAFGHDAAGRESARRIGDGLALLTQSWDSAHRLIAQTLTARGGETLQSRGYAYRSDGYPTATRELGGGERMFDLDAVGRITAARTEGGADTDEAFAYDRAGRLVGAGVRETPVEQRFDGTLIRASGRTRFSYDAQGRVTERTRSLLSGGRKTWRYTWDADDRLIRVTTPDGHTWRYRYDPLGRRIAKEHLDADGTTVRDLTTFVWDGTRLVEQSGAGTTRTWEWHPTEESPVSQLDQADVDSRFYAIVTDLVGSPAELVGEDGRIAWRRSATVWGAATVADGAGTDCPLRFPGQYADAETGLHYNLHRYYDPATSRYQSPDPLGLAPGPDPHGYVLNPQVWSDPLGLAPCKILADTDLMVKAMRGHANALAEILGKDVHITPNQLREFLNVTNGLNARRAFLRAHDITVIGGSEAARIASDPAFREIFDKVIKQGHSRGDAALVGFAHVTGIEAVTMERRLSNVVIHTLKFPNLIRRVI